MPLYDTEYTHALIMAMVCSLAAFLLCWLWNLASAELHRHGAGKMFLFAALAVPLALWSVGKVGGGASGGAQMGGASATYAYDGIGNLATSIWNTAATTYSANEHVWIMERNGARWLSGFMDTGETMCLV